MNLDSEFGKGQKQECIKYCETHNLQFFQRDLNSSSSKLFMATTYRGVWNKLRENGVAKSHYYESWTATQAMKLYIDYDKKVDLDDDLKKRSL